MAWDNGMFKGWGQGGWDKGNIGDFGGADYLHALKKGGTSNIDERQASRDAVKKWMLHKTKVGDQQVGPQGYGDWKGQSAFQGPIKDMILKGTELGDTSYGDYKKDSEAGKWYTEADWLAGQSMGQSNKDIQTWLSEEGLGKIKSGSDILKKVTDRADDEWEAQMNKDKKAKIKTAVDDAITKSRKGYIPESDYKSLKDDLGGEISALKDKISLSEQEAAKTKFSGPVAVGGSGSAMSIRAASKKKAGFRGTLAGLTRPQSPTQALKVQTLNL